MYGLALWTLLRTGQPARMVNQSLTGSEDGLAESQDRPERGITNGHIVHHTVDRGTKGEKNRRPSHGALAKLRRAAFLPENRPTLGRPLTFR
jgi:hypothetical protein